MKAAVEATGLSKRFGSVWALRDCCVQIPTGRVVALIGPNGAGKTTLLRLCAGLDAPTAGHLEVLGWSPIRDTRIVLPRLAFVAQERPLYQQFAVAELLELGRRLNPRWDGTLARHRLDRLGIPLKRRINQLSGGQQAQVALSMALAKTPELVLLDEPVSGLDPLARRQFLQGLMEAVAENGLSVVLSSHIVSELERTCDYLLILSRGQIQVSGDIDQLLERHRILTGPRVDRSFETDPTVIQFSHSDRETTLLVCDGSREISSGWESHPVALEDLVLAYLSRPEAGIAPPPRVAAS
jgi:ABC-2 type transport system ATP-binding protein